MLSILYSAGWAKRIRYQVTVRHINLRTLSCPFHEHLFNEAFSLSAIWHWVTALHLTALVKWGWRARRIRTEAHPSLQPACGCPSPETAGCRADSGLTQRKSATYCITSASSCSTWDFLQESPNWRYPAFKLSLETECNTEWLQDNSELLKGFWQKLERVWERQKRNLLGAGRNPKAFASYPKMTQVNSVRSNGNYSDEAVSRLTELPSQIFKCYCLGGKILSIHAPWRPRVPKLAISPLPGHHKPMLKSVLMSDCPRSQKFSANQSTWIAKKQGK